MDLDAVAKTTQTVAKTATEGATAATPFLIKFWTVGDIYSMPLCKACKWPAAAYQLAPSHAYNAHTSLHNTQFLTTTDAVTLAEYGLGAFGAYLLAPVLLGAFAGSMRGYAGGINAVSVRACCMSFRLVW